MPTMASSALKLRAQDADDLAVIAAFLQDAIVPLCDLVFYAEEKRFILVAQRLCRENVRESGQELMRTCTALNIFDVTAVQTMNLDQTQHGLMLDLLTLTRNVDGITLIFAGNAQIKLSTTTGTAMMEDFGEPWPAACAPCHEDSTGTK